MPLIDILSDLDLAAIETNSAELLDAVLVHIGLRLELYGVLFQIPAPTPMQTTIIQLERARPEPPIRRTGVSSRHVRTG